MSTSSINSSLSSMEISLSTSSDNSDLHSLVGSRGEMNVRRPKNRGQGSRRRGRGRGKRGRGRGRGKYRVKRAGRLSFASGSRTRSGSVGSSNLSAATIAVLNEIGFEWKKQEPTSYTQPYTMTLAQLLLMLLLKVLLKICSAVFFFFYR